MNHQAEQRFNDASVLHKRIKARFDVFMRSKGQDAAAEKDIRESVPRGLYELWKSKEGELKYYVVYGAGCELDVYTPLVPLAALYAPHAGHMTFRNLINDQRGFLAPIRRDGYVGSRYNFVVGLSWAEIGILLQYVGELSVIKDSAKFRLHCSKLLQKSVPLV